MSCKTILNNEIVAYFIAIARRSFTHNCITVVTGGLGGNGNTHRRRAAVYVSDNRCNAIHINLLATLDQVSIPSGVFERRCARRTRLPFDVCRCTVPPRSPTATRPSVQYRLLFTFMHAVYWRVVYVCRRFVVDNGDSDVALPAASSDSYDAFKVIKVTHVM